MQRHNGGRIRAPRPLPHRSDRFHATVSTQRSRKERTTMHPHQSLARVIHAERAERWAAEAEAERLLGPPRRPIRQRLGRSIVRIGERLAAEPPRRPVRSR